MKSILTPFLLFLFSSFYLNSIQAENTNSVGPLQSICIGTDHGRDGGHGGDSDESYVMPCFNGSNSITIFVEPPEDANFDGSGFTITSPSIPDTVFGSIPSLEDSSDGSVEVGSGIRYSNIIINCDEGQDFTEIEVEFCLTISYNDALETFDSEIFDTPLSGPNRPCIKVSLPICCEPYLQSDLPNHGSEGGDHQFIYQEEDEFEMIYPSLATDLILNDAVEKLNNNAKDVIEISNPSHTTTSHGGGHPLQSICIGTGHDHDRGGDDHDDMECFNGYYNTISISSSTYGDFGSVNYTISSPSLNTTTSGVIDSEGGFSETGLEMSDFILNCNGDGVTEIVIIELCLDMGYDEADQVFPGLGLISQSESVTCLFAPIPICCDFVPYNDGNNIIDETKKENESVIVYPTLATDVISIEGVEAFKKGQIFSSNNNSVSSFSLDRKSNKMLDVSSLSSGVYYVVFYNENERIVKRFIKM